MDNRVALIGIMVENPDSIETMNRILHEYGQYIIGRMGLPYRERGLSIISIVLDAPMNQISSLSGKLGMLDGISTKTICCAHPCSQAAHLPLPFRKAPFPKPSALPKALSKPAPRKFL